MGKHLVFVSLLSACIVGDGSDDTDELDIDPLAATAKFTVVQHNVEKKLVPIQNALGVNSADAITLQEVCPTDVTMLRQKAQQKGWSIAVQSVPNRGTCENATDPSVVAIWTGGANAVVSTVAQLGTTAGKPGQAACLAFTFKKVPTHVCSVKLISTDQSDGDGAAETIRETQTRDLKQLAQTWFGGKDEFGVIAGDFNANTNQPSIDKLYAPQIGGNGDFTEYNRGAGNTRDGKPTAHGDGDVIGKYDKKIDYVFFSTNRVPINPGPAVVITPDPSDHDMVVSSALMKK
ncbi:MAG: endonuclease/exonuclease/phosphatase family protein [Kofleriaceae bacterium]